MHAWLPFLAFGAGLVSSSGPCVAPRFLAAAVLCSGEAGFGRWCKLVAFASGLCLGYLVLQTFYGAFANVSAYSAYVYGALAAGSLAAGGYGLLQTQRATSVVGGHRTHGAALLFGSILASVNSPCCGPLSIAAGFAGFGILFDPLAGAAFAAGHALPVFGVGFGSSAIERLLGTYWHREAAATVGGALAIALGAYYAVLA